MRSLSEWRFTVWRHAMAFIIRAQEPKAPVTYWDHALSGVRCPLDNLHFGLLLQNRLLDFNETWYAWSTQCPLQVLLFSVRSAQGQIRQIQGGAELGHRGSPSSKNFFFDSDLKVTATNRMHSNDLEAYGKKCCYFWFHSEVKFLTRFDVFLDLDSLPYFNAISTGFYAVKWLIKIYFV